MPDDPSVLAGTSILAHPDLAQPARTARPVRQVRGRATPYIYPAALHAISRGWTRIAGVRAVVREGLPLLAYASFAQSALNLSLARLPSRPVTTVFIPLLPLALCMYACLSPSARRSRWLYLAVAYLLLVGFLALAYVPTGAGTLSWKSLIWPYELSMYAAYPLLALHCLATRGRFAAAELFVVATIYGCVLESAGVGMGFFAERGYDHYLPLLAAPLVTMLGWTVVLYPCVGLVDLFARRWPALRGSVLASAALITTLGLALDLQLDPVATGVGFWRWHPLLRGAYLGVPLLNYVAWFYAVLGFGLAYYGVQRVPVGASRLRAFAVALLLALPIEGILVFLTMGLAEGFNGPTITILRAYLRAHLAIG